MSAQFKHTLCFWHLSIGLLGLRGKTSILLRERQMFLRTTYGMRDDWIGF